MSISILNDKDLLQKAVDQSANSAQVLESFGLKPGSGNYVTLRKYYKKFGIVTNFKKCKRTKQVSINTYFTADSQTARASIKRKIIKNKLIPYRCLSCGLSDRWNGQPLSLQLEHINGINNDNRLENLAFICPNCHSQTSTYAGKNKNPSRLTG